MVNAISSLVGEELQDGGCKFRGTMAAPNGSLYGIPRIARRVIKFNPIDKSMTEIGPDFGFGHKWIECAITPSGVIYCVPNNSRRGILKIDTNTDNTTVLDVNLLPEQGQGMWESCAVALDGCIYFMPRCARRIMKLDPNNNDAMSSVGDDLGIGWKYIGMVVGIDGCVYGLPFDADHILKYNPINGSTSFIGLEAEPNLRCIGNGVVSRDGYIYAAVSYGRVMKIDTTNNSYCIVGNKNKVESKYKSGWMDGILGIDGCIYWPPLNAARILKYDPHSNLTSLVGDDFGNHGECKWSIGCAAPDGVIYCLPYKTNRILAIDPMKEYTLSLSNNMEEHPEEFGRIFQPSDDIPDDTHFDRAVTKFGQTKILELLDECMAPVHQSCIVSNLHPFMIAASCKGGHLSVIYHLVRKMPSFVHCTNRFSNV